MNDRQIEPLPVGVKLSDAMREGSYYPIAETLGRRWQPVGELPTRDEIAQLMDDTRCRCTLEVGA